MTGAARFEVDDRAAVALLDRLRAAGADPLRLNADIGGAFVELAAASFNDASDPWGGAWEPLSPVTIARRRQASSKPLNDFGFLRASLTHSADAGGVEVHIGREDRPAGPHQFGAPGNRMFGKAPAPIPARPMLPIDESGVRLEGTDYADTLLDIAEQYLAEAVSP